MKISALSPKSPRRRGFTLLELVIAVVILAIISAVALPIYSTLQTNSQLSAEASQLANINREALSIATANGRSVPTAADITAALNDTPSFGAAAGLAATSSVTVSTSTSGTVIPSSSSTVLSADVSTGSVGLALNSPAGGCVMSLLVGTKVSSWFYKGALGYNCNGTQALQGASQPTLTYSAGPAPTAPVISAAVADASGDGAADLTWSASSANGGAAITGYTITYTDNGLQAPYSTSPQYWGGTPNPYYDVYAGHAATSTCGPWGFISPTSISTTACATTATSFSLFPSYYTGQYVYPDCGYGHLATQNFFFYDSVTFTVTVKNALGQTATSAPFTTTINGQSALGNSLAC